MQLSLEQGALKLYLDDRTELTIGSKNGQLTQLEIPGIFSWRQGLATVSHAKLKELGIGANGIVRFSKCFPQIETNQFAAGAIIRGVIWIPIDSRIEEIAA